MSKTIHFKPNIGHHCLLECALQQKKESGVAQLCLILCDPVDCSLPRYSIHGIFQAIVLKWAAISFSRDLPYPGIKHGSPAL